MGKVETLRDISSIQNEQVWVDSRELAAYYSMQHKNLLRIINNKIETLQELREYAINSSYKDKKGEKRPMILIRKEHLSKFIQYGKKKIERIEFDYTNALQDRVGGVREVKTDFGAIDLLTDSSLYEVKKFAQYKNALGQLFAYGSVYPKHKLVVAFFELDNIEEEFMNKVVALFNANNIDVLLLEEKKDVVIKDSNGSEFNQMNLFNN